MGGHIAHSCCAHTVAASGRQLSTEIAGQAAVGLHMNNEVPTSGLEQSHQAPAAAQPPDEAIAEMVRTLDTLPH